MSADALTLFTEAGEPTTSARPATINLRVPRARPTDPQTSHAAARKAVHGTETHLRILALLETHGPLTDEALHAAYLDHYGPISASGCRTRRNELVEDRRVMGAGTVRPAGRRCDLTLWKVAA